MTMELRDFIKALSKGPVYEVQAGEDKGLEYVAISVKSMNHIIEWLEQTADIVEACEDLADELPGPEDSLH
jgi:hypothetical protein